MTDQGPEGEPDAAPDEPVNPFEVLDPKTRADLDQLGDFMSGYGLDHEPIGWMDAAMLLADGDKRQVALDDVEVTDGVWTVSTVFMPWDMGHGRTSTPVLYESMALDGAGEIRKVERYPTRDQALAGHDQVVAWVRAGGPAEPLPWADVLFGDEPVRGPAEQTDDETDD